MTVILAAGDFPRPRTPARKLLDAATRVVCCDSAADAYRLRTGREPTVVVGDCDSVKGRFAHMVRVDEQDTNDLEKAIRLCGQRHWNNPVLLGVTGKRDDHAIGNLFRGMAHGLEIVTNYGRFVPVRGTLTLRLAKGTPVSVFATRGTRMTSVGLAWPINDVVFENFYCATLNRTNAARQEITANGPAYVYVANGELVAGD